MDKSGTFFIDPGVYKITLQFTQTTERSKQMNKQANKQWCSTSTKLERNVRRPSAYRLTIT